MYETSCYLVSKEMLKNKKRNRLSSFIFICYLMSNIECCSSGFPSINFDSHDANSSIS